MMKVFTGHNRSTCAEGRRGPAGCAKKGIGDGA